jgi:hypothetical protein
VYGKDGQLVTDPDPVIELSAMGNDPVLLADAGKIGILLSVTLSPALFPRCGDLSEHLSVFPDERLLR